MKPKIVVTGGAGYIGSHTCKALAGDGYVPVTVDNLTSGHEWAVKWGPLEVADIRDLDLLTEILERHAPAAVLHFAGSIEAGESVENPIKYYDNNVGGAISLIAAMARTECKSIVFSSTCATYGAPEKQPIDEGTAQNPINPYGRSKWMVEQILRDQASAVGMVPVMLRYFNACGADPDGEIGEAHEPESHLIPRAIMAARGEIDRLDLNGVDYDTPDGTAIRDYIHVCDLAEGHLAALRRLQEGGGPGAFNLGTGRGASVREVIGAVERVSGRTVPLQVTHRRSGDMPVLVADTTRARNELGFSPKYTDLDAIIETAWNWHVSR